MKSEVEVSCLLILSKFNISRIFFFIKIIYFKSYRNNKIKVLIIINKNREVKKISIYNIIIIDDLQKYI